MKKKYLEIILDNLKTHPNPKIEYEQYSIEGKLASEILTFAKNDIKNNIVIDLGCGTGIFSIGVLLLGAKFVIGIDIDKESIFCAKENLNNLKSIDIINKLYNNNEIKNFKNKIIFKEENIKNINKEYINNILIENRITTNNDNNDNNDNNNNFKYIIIQNPPFGAQQKYADRIFLEKALNIGNIVYTIHNTPTRDFIINYVEKEHNRKITNIFQSDFKIKNIYEFHKKKFVNIPVDIYRIE